VPTILEEFFDLCLQWPLRCCLFLRHNTPTHDMTAVMIPITHRSSLLKDRDHVENCFLRHYHLKTLHANLLGTMHVILYENNTFQRKFFVHELESSFLIKNCIFLWHNTPTRVRFSRYYLVNCMRYSNVSLVKVSQLPLPTTVVPTHINIITL
jgi:hypothetical protein